MEFSFANRLILLTLILTSLAVLFQAASVSSSAVVPLQEQNKRFAVVVTGRSPDLTTLEGCEEGKKVVLSIPETEWPDSWKGHHEKGYVFLLKRSEQDGHLKFAGRKSPDCASTDSCCWEQHARDGQYEFPSNPKFGDDGSCTTKP